MKSVKMMGYIIAIIQISTLAIFALSFHTIYSIISTSLTGEAITFSADMDESAGEIKLNVEGYLMNSGLLGADLSFEVGIFSSQEELLATNYTSFYLDPGDRRPFVLSISLPSEEIVSGDMAGLDGFFDVTLRIRTLNDLVGFSNKLRIRGDEGV